MEISYQIIDYLINKGYTNSSFGDYNIYFDKIYNKKLYVSIYENSYKPDVINLSCLFPVSGIIDKSILSNFPYEEVQKQLTEIFGRCYVIRYIKETIQIIFYLDKEEEIIK